MPGHHKHPSGEPNCWKGRAPGRALSVPNVSSPPWALRKCVVDGDWPGHLNLDSRENPGLETQFGGRGGGSSRSRWSHDTRGSTSL